MTYQFFRSVSQQILSSSSIQIQICSNLFHFKIYTLLPKFFFTIKSLPFPSQHLIFTTLQLVNPSQASSFQILRRSEGELSPLFQHRRSEILQARAAVWGLSLEYNLKESWMQGRGWELWSTPCMQARKQWGNVPPEWEAGLGGWTGKKVEMAERRGSCKGP